MTVATAKYIACSIAQEGWNSRIEFAMHGEPTMNPNLLRIILAFRKELPNNQFMVLTNGGGLLKGGVVANLNNLFDAGLNIVGFDAYDSVKIKSKVEAAIYMDTHIGFDIYRYPLEKDASPHSRWPKDTHALVVIEDIATATDGTHATLNNHCGHGAALNDNGVGKRCAKPFREMAIRWNGMVSLCCNSFSGRYYCGDLRKSSIETIWNGEAFSIARKHLYHGLRTFIPCKGCDALSYRVGLLPDKKGKEKLARPTFKEAKWARDHGMERPLTREVIPVKIEEK